jgi:hypothetical protein
MNALRALAFLAAALAAFLAAPSAQAQVFVVGSCGTIPASMTTLVAGHPGFLTIDTNGNLCGSGNGGGAITAAINSYAVGALQDGADATEGTKADVPCTLPASATACSVVAIAKAIANAANNPPPLGISGGWTPTALTAITNSSQTVKGTAGQLGYAQCDNNNAVWIYLQFFNAASPVVGTNVGFIPIPPNLSGGFTLSMIGLQFSNSIKVAATTAPGGSSAPPTNTINCSFGYN